ncbi:MAG: DUF6089 family protein [Bacteroidota bacterium]
MRKLLLLASLPFFLLPIAQGQYLEVGAFTGISFYSGDLQHQTLELKEGNMAYGFFTRYNFSYRFSAKLHYYKGRISAKDENSSTHAHRNLHFQSDIHEIGLQGEFNLMPQRWDYSDKIAIYLFGGVSTFTFNPQAYGDEGWVDLQPLGTEGQGLPQYPDRQPYQLREFAIPFGVGMKLFANDFVNIGIELGARKTFTDYLDDVGNTYPDIVALAEVNPTAAAFSYRGDPRRASRKEGGPRGNPEFQDWYFFTGLTFSFNLFGYSPTTSEYRGIF